MEDGKFFARVSVVCYRPGMREQGDRIVEEILKRWYSGYRGYIIQRSLEEPDTSIYLTFWNSNDKMVEAMAEVPEDEFQALNDLALGVQAVHFTEVRDHWLHLEPE